MTDFLTRLIRRTLGLIPVVQPLIPSRFAPVSSLSEAYGMFPTIISDASLETQSPSIPITSAFLQNSPSLMPLGNWAGTTARLPPIQADLTSSPKTIPEYELSLDTVPRTAAQQSQENALEPAISQLPDAVQQTVSPSPQIENDLTFPTQQTVNSSGTYLEENLIPENSNPLFSQSTPVVEPPSILASQPPQIPSVPLSSPLPPSAGQGLTQLPQPSHFSDSSSFENQQVSNEQAIGIKSSSEVLTHPIEPTTHLVQPSPNQTTSTTLQLGQQVSQKLASVQPRELNQPNLPELTSNQLHPVLHLDTLENSNGSIQFLQKDNFVGQASSLPLNPSRLEACSTEDIFTKLGYSHSNPLFSQSTPVVESLSVLASQPPQIQAVPLAPPLPPVAGQGLTQVPQPSHFSDSSSFENQKVSNEQVMGVQSSSEVLPHPVTPTTHLVQPSRNQITSATQQLGQQVSVELASVQPRELNQPNLPEPTSNQLHPVLQSDALKNSNGSIPFLQKDNFVGQASSLPLNPSRLEACSTEDIFTKLGYSHSNPLFSQSTPVVESLSVLASQPPQIQAVPLASPLPPVAAQGLTQVPQPSHFSDSSSFENQQVSNEQAIGIKSSSEVLPHPIEPTTHLVQPSPNQTTLATPQLGQQVSVQLASVQPRELNQPNLPEPTSNQLHPVLQSDALKNSNGSIPFLQKDNFVGQASSLPLNPSRLEACSTEDIFTKLGYSHSNPLFSQSTPIFEPLSVLANQPPQIQAAPVSSPLPLVTPQELPQLPEERRFPNSLSPDNHHSPPVQATLMQSSSEVLPSRVGPIANLLESNLNQNTLETQQLRQQVSGELASLPLSPVAPQKLPQLPTKVSSVLPVVKPVSAPQPSHSQSGVQLVPQLSQQSSLSAANYPQVKIPEQPHGFAADRRTTPTPTTPTIQITIGRVEVRGVQPPSSQPPRTRKTQRSPSLSLQDYLKQRNEEKS